MLLLLMQYLEETEAFYHATHEYTLPEKKPSSISFYCPIDQLQRPYDFFSIFIIETKLRSFWASLRHCDVPAEGERPLVGERAPKEEF